MSYKILVTSPLHQTGVSVVSILLNHLMTVTGKTSTLMFTQNNCPTPDYLGLVHSDADPTKSAMQVVRLLENGVIGSSDVLDYTIPYISNGYLLDTTDSAITADRAQAVINSVYSKVPTNIVICDDSSSEINTRADSIFETSDAIFVVINPSRKNYTRLKEFMDELPKELVSRVILVLNQYTEVVGSIRDVAKEIRWQPSKICKLHYNPYIVNCCLRGYCKDIVPLARRKDPRLANLYGDFEEFADCVSNLMVSGRF